MEGCHARIDAIQRRSLAEASFLAVARKAREEWDIGRRHAFLEVFDFPARHEYDCGIPLVNSPGRGTRSRSLTS